MFLSEDENFLLLFRRETPLDSSVEFMQVSVWLCLYGGWGQDPSHLLWLPPLLPSPQGTAAHRGQDQAKKPLCRAWPQAPMCSLSVLARAAPELTNSLAWARGRLRRGARQAPEACNGRVGWGPWSLESTCPSRAQSPVSSSQLLPSGNAA